MKKAKGIRSRGFKKCLKKLKKSLTKAKKYDIINISNETIKFFKKEVLIMATIKITKKMNAQAILSFMETLEDETVLATVDGVDITVDTATEYLTHEVELLDKKRSSKGSKKVNEENQRLQGIILEVLSTADEAKTVSEVMKMHEDLNTLSNQKVSALMRGLVNDEKVAKTTEKGKSLFALA